LLYMPISNENWFKKNWDDIPVVYHRDGWACSKLNPIVCAQIAKVAIPWPEWPCHLA
jgi:hypothetical protein